jgi:CheY-like chemotaxis protein
MLDGTLAAAVNDEPAIIELLCVLLMEEGYAVVAAASGAAAHTLIRHSPGARDRPDRAERPVGAVP